MISLSFSIWLLWSNLYYRPTLYFALVLVTAASIILDIFYLDKIEKTQTYTILFKIIILCLSVYAGLYWEFPCILGADPWRHNVSIQGIIDFGHLDVQFMPTYYAFPLFHIENAMVHLLTSLSPYNSVFASTGLLVAISCVFVFLIGSEVSTEKIGLLSALVWAFNPYSIERATAITTNSLGFCFFATILYLIFCHERKTGSITFLIILFSAALILTHHVSAFITLVFLIIIFIGITLYNRINRHTIAYGLISSILIILFGVMMLTRWMQPPPGSHAFFDLTLRNLIMSVKSEAQVTLGSALNTNVHYGTFLLDFGGELLLLGFSIIAILMYLHSKNRNATRIALSLIAVVPFVIVNVPFFFLQNIVPWRWYMFIYLPLSILAIQGLFSLFNLIKSNTAKLSIVALIALAVLSSMLTNTRANGDSPLFYNGTQRFGYTQAELTTIHTLSDIKCGNPQTDVYFGDIFRYMLGHKSYMAMITRDNEVFIKRNYYLYHPEWDQKFMAYITKGVEGELDSSRVISKGQVLVLSYIREHEIDKQPLIYNNGDTWVYTIPKTL